jgi:non-specific serine/threonine protein kinase
VLAEAQDGGTMRYRLLETVGQYALEKLRQAGEETTLRARHRDWYLGLAEAAELKLRTAEHQEWLACLEAERDNLRLAIAWDQQHSGEAPAPTWFRLVGALWWFWHLRGYADEAERHLERALSAGLAASPAVRAKLLNGAGLLLSDRGEYARAVTLLEEALGLCRAISDDWGIAFALGNLGFVLHNQDDYQRAEACLEESLAVARRAGHTLNVARSLNSLGLVARAIGDHARAVTLYQESLALWRELRNNVGIAQSLCFLGWAMRGLGDGAQARVCLEESLALSRDAGYTRGTAWSLTYLGRVALDQDDPARAVPLYAESLELQRQLGNTRAIAANLEGLAGAAVAQARLPSAARMLGAAAALRDAIGASPQPADVAMRARTIAAVQASLGDERFAALWLEGQAMSADEAIAHALASDGPSSLPTGESGTPTVDPRRAGLTPREREVAALVAEGLSNRQIGEALVITEGTANVHVKHILNKLGFTSRAQVAAWVVQEQLSAPTVGAES